MNSKQETSDISIDLIPFEPTEFKDLSIKPEINFEEEEEKPSQSKRLACINSLKHCIILITILIIFFLELLNTSLIEIFFKKIMNFNVTQFKECINN